MKLIVKGEKFSQKTFLLINNHFLFSFLNQLNPPRGVEEIVPVVLDRLVNAVEFVFLVSN